MVICLTFKKTAKLFSPISGSHILTSYVFETLLGFKFVGDGSCSQRDLPGCLMAQRFAAGVSKVGENLEQMEEPPFLSLTQFPCL